MIPVARRRGKPLRTLTLPHFGTTSSARSATPIIAPFYADVDTRSPDSSSSGGGGGGGGSGGINPYDKDSSHIIVNGDPGNGGSLRYYPTTVNARNAFEVDWTNVDYFSGGKMATPSNCTLPSWNRRSGRRAASFAVEHLESRMLPLVATLGLAGRFGPRTYTSSPLSTTARVRAPSSSPRAPSR
jgi:hypothetical protein